MTVFAMIFPGQGSQTVGMLAELAAQYSEVQAIFSEASEVLSYDLWKLVQRGPIEELNKTWKTQPALLAASVAIWEVWKKVGGEIPMLMAGHSLGEYSALVCSGVLEFPVAIKLVALRGRLMQEAVPPGIGAMFAIIGLDHVVIAAICVEEARGQIVSPVNFNSPVQVVISGHREAVERAAIACKAAGAKCAVPLPVSVPSHCALIRPAADRLTKILEVIKFSVPQIPVVNNVNVCVEQDPVAIRQALICQLYSPVRWTETIEYLAAQGIEVLLELGPGKVLTGFTKRIISTLSVAAVNDPASLGIAMAK